MIGPTLKIIEVWTCAGCDYLHAPQLLHRPHRCTHPEAMPYARTTNGVYMGMTGETPGWCPIQKLKLDAGQP